jgi:hypothetical protein
MTASETLSVTETQTATVELTAAMTFTQTQVPDVTATNTPDPTPTTPPTAIDEGKSVSYPNPVNPATQDMYAAFRLDKDCKVVKLKVFTSTYRLVLETKWDNLDAGYYVKKIDRAGLQSNAAGIYYYYVEGDGNKKGKITPFVILK